MAAGGSGCPSPLPQSGGRIRNKEDERPGMAKESTDPPCRFREKGLLASSPADGTVGPTSAAGGRRALAATAVISAAAATLVVAPRSSRWEDGGAGDAVLIPARLVQRAKGVKYRVASLQGIIFHQQAERSASLP
eukprot:scaffold5064_cov115-Isochrysis_galbana.AAC.19